MHLVISPEQGALDFVASNGEVILSSTITEGFIEVAIVDDTVVEEPETFGIMLMVAEATTANIQIPSAVLTVTITSDDGRYENRGV